MTIALPALTPRSRGEASLRDLVRKIVRGAMVAAGCLVVVAGVVIAPLPGPMGLPLVILGLVMVLRNSFWAKRQFVRAHRAHPRYVSPLRRLLRRDPEVMPVLWQQMLRAERLVIPRHWRALRRLRRMSRNKAARQKS